MRTCDEPQCTAKHYALGKCASHYWGLRNNSRGIKRGITPKLLNSIAFHCSDDQVRLMNDTADTMGINRSVFIRMAIEYYAEHIISNIRDERMGEKVNEIAYHDEP